MVALVVISVRGFPRLHALSRIGASMQLGHRLMIFPNQIDSHPLKWEHRGQSMPQCSALRDGTRCVWGADDVWGNREYKCQEVGCVFKMIGSLTWFHVSRLFYLQYIIERSPRLRKEYFCSKHDGYCFIVL